MALVMNKIRGDGHGTWGNVLKFGEALAFVLGFPILLGIFP